MIVLLFLIAVGVLSYKPIIFLHGVGGSFHDFDGPKKWINQLHPGTTIVSLDFYNLLDGFVSLKYQIPKVIDLIRKTKTDYGIEDGYHLVTHSQGGVVGRAILHMMDDHGAGDWISMATPAVGQYGIPEITLPKDLDFLLNLTLSAVTDILFTKVGQDTISFADYWFSPYQYEEYLTKNLYLPIWNNETFNPDSQQYKENFMKVEKMVFLGSPHDGIIKPWQSEHWGQFKQDSVEEIVSMEEQEWYLKDSFGMKTMNEAGRIKLQTVEYVPHDDWVLSKVVFDNYVVPYLD